jgi:hypothetical protein
MSSAVVQHTVIQARKCISHYRNHFSNHEPTFSNSETVARLLTFERGLLNPVILVFVPLTFASH